MREENVQAQDKFTEAINSGNLEDFDTVMSPKVIDHDPASSQQQGVEGFKGFFAELRTAFPDLQVNPDHVTATDEDVAIAYTITGTHQGDFMGVAPTGKNIEARGCQVTRFEGGKMVERWGSSDELGILKQLGANSL